MFFLAGVAGGPGITRQCTVPRGTALFLPIANVECSTVESANSGFHAENAQLARACAASWAAHIPSETLKFSIDGKSVEGLEKYRVQSPYFEFTIPLLNNYLGTRGRTSGWSVSDGYWIMLKPLAPGAHVIHFEANWEASPQDVTYSLNVP